MIVLWIQVYFCYINLIMLQRILLYLLILLPYVSKGQFVLKVKATNTTDSIGYLRASLFDERNFVPKDTLNLTKPIQTIKNTKSIVGGIYFIYFPKSKQKIQFNKDREFLWSRGSAVKIFLDYYIKGYLFGGLFFWITSLRSVILLGIGNYLFKGWPSLHSGILFGGLKLIQNLRLRRCFFVSIIFAQASLAR